MFWQDWVNYGLVGLSLQIKSSTNPSGIKHCEFLRNNHALSFGSNVLYKFTILSNGLCISHFLYTVGQYYFCNPILKQNFGCKEKNMYIFVICILLLFKRDIKQAIFMKNKKKQNYCYFYIFSKCKSYPTQIEKLQFYFTWQN